MARIWKSDARNRVNPLIPDWIYFVEVGGFTFRFRDVRTIGEYLDYFHAKRIQARRIEFPMVVTVTATILSARATLTACRIIYTKGQNVSKS